MKVRTVGYYFQEALTSLRRNGLMALASVGTVAVALLILGGALLTVLNANNIMKSVENELLISVYLQEGVDETAIGDLEQQINDTPGVAKSRFISKEESLEKLRQQFGETKGSLEFSRNPLPDSFEVNAEKSNLVKGIADKIRGLSGVEKVNYPAEVVQKLSTLVEWVRLIGAVIIILLALAAVFLISTTIRLTVFARRREIGIMKFLGATNWFIRWPFVLEGVFLGLAGALVSGLILYFVNFYIVEAVKQFPFMRVQTDMKDVYIILGSLLGGGIFIGAIGSVISVRKFLQV
ncbi:MAG: permease-like cell division protein FtsX [Clostridia bacterium]|nr:permease-like cell division protein FtsX [Clostridia bacterium]